jgi:tRNA A-37 threonylcarbamoyl transferase component Bud32
MDTTEPLTVDTSLGALSDAVGKASVDLLAVKSALDAARVDIASHNTSMTRAIVGHAERAIDHLRAVDESLREVLKDLSERD